MSSSLRAVMVKNVVCPTVTDLDPLSASSSLPGSSTQDVAFVVRHRRSAWPFTPTFGGSTSKKRLIWGIGTVVLFCANACRTRHVGFASSDLRCDRAVPAALAAGLTSAFAVAARTAIGADPVCQLDDVLRWRRGRVIERDVELHVSA